MYHLAYFILYLHMDLVYMSFDHTKHGYNLHNLYRFHLPLAIIYHYNHQDHMISHHFELFKKVGILYKSLVFQLFPLACVAFSAFLDFIEGLRARRACLRAVL